LFAAYLESPLRAGFLASADRSAAALDERGTSGGCFRRMTIFDFANSGLQRSDDGSEHHRNDRASHH
jgi:hypothetical protein